MDTILLLSTALAATSLLCLLLTWLLLRARRHTRTLRSAKQSQSVRYGQITEQFAPFMDTWPWDPKGFRFLGTPIDGVQFTDEGIVFVEIKSAGSRLSGVQRAIRDHVKAGRVAWSEIRVS